MLGLTKWVSLATFALLQVATKSSAFVPQHNPRAATTSRRRSFKASATTSTPSLHLRDQHYPLSKSISLGATRAKDDVDQSSAAYDDATKLLEEVVNRFKTGNESI